MMILDKLKAGSYTFIKQKLIRYVKLGVLFYVGILVVLVMLERFLVYPAPARSAGDWSATSYGVEDVEFASADGTNLHGWFLDHPNPRAYVLFCHGNGEHVGYFGEWLNAVSQGLDVAIFAFDYRGYGKSGGSPFERGLLEDGEAAQEWLANRAGLRANDIVLYGRSLGGAVVVHLAAEKGARALVAEKTFHSMVEIGAAQYPWVPVRWLMRNRYPSADRIAKYSGPLLQMHGTDDRLVPLNSAQRLFNACPSEKKSFMEIAGHGHNTPAPPQFLHAFNQLLEDLPPVSAHSPAVSRE